ncbi:MAG: ABC transporter substrate-binding protein, partial [Longimicrobiales bacterium]
MRSSRPLTLEQLSATTPMRARPRAWSLLATVLVAGACGGEPPAIAAAIQVVDDGGDTVRLDAPARRIASLIPAQTDIILALGAADRLIVRTEWDVDPRVADVASVGNALAPSVEWLVVQSPDLVIAWTDEQSRTAVARLRGLGIAVYASRMQTVADVERNVQRVGTLLGLE